MSGSSILVFCAAGSELTLKDREALKNNSENTGTISVGFLNLYSSIKPANFINQFLISIVDAFAHFDNALNSPPLH